MGYVGRRHRRAVEEVEPGACGPTGVVEQGMCTLGSFQEPGRPGRLHGESRQGQPAPQTPGPSGPRRGPTGAASGRSTKASPPAWYRQAKATKRGGTGGRESEHPIVPWKPGNSPQRTR
jgi:hypothetical protein